MRESPISIMDCFENELIYVRHDLELNPRDEKEKNEDLIFRIPILDIVPDCGRNLRDMKGRALVDNGSKLRFDLHFNPFSCISSKTCALTFAY